MNTEAVDYLLCACITVVLCDLIHRHRQKKRQAQLDDEVRANYKYKALVITSGSVGGERSSTKGIQYGRFLVPWDLLHHLEHIGSPVDLYKIKGVSDMKTPLPGDLDGIYICGFAVALFVAITYSLSWVRSIWWGIYPKQDFIH